MSDFSLKAVLGMDSAGFKSEIRSLGGEMKSFGASLLDVVGFAGVTATFVALARGAMESATAIKNLSLDIGINAQSYQALQFEAEQSGVSQEKFDEGLKKVKESVIEAAEGNQKLADAFADLGLDAGYLLQLPLDRQYAAIATAVHGAANQASAYNDVVEIFGSRVGPGLMSSLTDLAEQGLPAVTAQAEKAGQVMDNKTIVALAHAEEAIDSFKKRITVALGTMLVDFRTGPGLEAIGYRLLEYGTAFGGKLVDVIAQASDLIDAVINGALTGAANNFRNLLLSAAEEFAKKMSDYAPTLIDAWANAVKKMYGSTAGSFAKLAANALKVELHVAPGDIAALKTTGDGVSDSIDRAIAKTKPTEFSKEFSSFYKGLADSAQQAADNLDKSDFSKGIKQLKDAGKPIAQDITQAATTAAKTLDKAGIDLGQELAKAAGLFNLPDKLATQQDVTDIQNAALAAQQGKNRVYTGTDPSFGNQQLQDMWSQRNTTASLTSLISNLSAQLTQDKNSDNSTIENQIPALEEAIAQAQRQLSAVSSQNVNGVNAAAPDYSNTLNQQTQLLTGIKTSLNKITG